MMCKAVIVRSVFKITFLTSMDVWNINCNFRNEQVPGHILILLKNAWKGQDNNARSTKSIAQQCWTRCTCRYVLTQFNSHTLNTHITNSYPPAVFGGPKKQGFVDVLACHQTPNDNAWYRGSADAVRRNLPAILEQYRGAGVPDELLILSGQALYNMVRLEYLIQVICFYSRNIYLHLPLFVVLDVSLDSLHQLSYLVKSVCLSQLARLSEKVT